MSSICAEYGSQVLDLKSHLKIHKDSKVECEVCGKVLTNRKAFRNHMQTHKSWSCPICQIVIPHNSRTMHLKKCMKEEQKELNCEECAYVTTDKSNLNKHIKTHQQNRPEFKCENCEKVFSSKVELKKHMKTHISMIKPT